MQCGDASSGTWGWIPIRVVMKYYRMVFESDFNTRDKQMTNNPKYYCASSDTVPMKGRNETQTDGTIRIKLRQETWLSMIESVT